MNLRKGFIYLIRAENNLYKIGRSKRPGKRLLSLRDAQSQHPGSPLEIELLMTIPTNDMEALEKVLHSRFGTKRHHGEWFELTKEDIDHLLHFDQEVELAILYQASPDEREHLRQQRRGWKRLQAAS